MDQSQLSFQKIFLLSFFSILLLINTIPALAQQTKGTIKGHVGIQGDGPAENVSVSLKGTKYGTITNENGDFTLRVPQGTYIIVISQVGSKSQETPVELAAGQTIVLPNFTVNNATNNLQEVSVSSNKVNKFKRTKSQDVAKMPLNNLENPQVYTTVSKELILEQAVFSADDAIKNSPGITKLWTPTNRTGDGGSYFTLRGFPVQAKLRNGLSGNISNAADAANLEKLEVIKGPSGTLYGSSLVSYGGLLNRVTKKPFDAEAGEISYSFGSYSFNRASIDYNTPIDQEKKALLRINSAYTNAGSFQDVGMNKSFVFDPSFSYKVNDRLNLSFEAEISHTRSTTPPIFYFGSTIADLGVTRANQLNIDYKRAYQSNDLVQTSDNANFFAQADYKISDQWHSQTSISTTHSSGDGPEPYFYLLAGNNSISRNVWDVTGNTNTLQIQQNFTGDFKLGKLRNRIVAGLDFLNEKSNIKYTDPNNGSDAFDVINITGPIPAYNHFNKAKVDSLFQNVPVTSSYSRYNNYTYSAYASDVLNITDNLLVMASLRVDHFVTKPINDPVSGTSTQGYNQTTLSPKFGLVYQVVKDKVSLFGNYMNGFSNPGYYLAYDAASNSNASKLFKSEQANQWEGGVKIDIFDGKLSSTISYYDISVKNKVRADAAHANAYVQDGTQKSKGIEAEVIANPFKGFNIIAGYAHNNSLMEKSGDYDNGRRPQTAGPANSANLWLSYTLTAGQVKGLGIGFGGNYSGDNQVINNSYNGVFTLPSFTVLNTGVFYNKEKYRFALNVNNLTNKEYWIGYTTVSPQMLRQIIGSVAFKF
ncbi:TonB-dependent receptor [Mucilaginibacter sp.]|uniref:TonB-dependent receptor n=1 Tax=Mucilaginibacter sp. TaxID=1882438 RepID=UPI002ED01880